MSYHSKPLNALNHFIPEGSFPLVYPFIVEHKIGLTITKSRKSKYGDYTYDYSQKKHKISVNGTLNKYEFLITLLHEIAHLITFEQYKNKVAPHGLEWKNNFKKILEIFIQKNIFPTDIKNALASHIHSVKATHCRDAQLVKVLQSYNEYPTIYISDLEIGTTFQVEDGKLFILKEKLRTRYKCQNLQNLQWYVFPSSYPVIPIQIDGFQ